MLEKVYNFYLVILDFLLHINSNASYVRIGILVRKLRFIYCQHHHSNLQSIVIFDSYINSLSRELFNFQLNFLILLLTKIYTTDIWYIHHHYCYFEASILKGVGSSWNWGREPYFWLIQLYSSRMCWKSPSFYRRYPYISVLLKYLRSFRARG